MIITEKTNKSGSGCLGWIIVAVIITIIGCMSCGKTQLQPPPTEFYYEMIIDWHNLDTTMLKPRAYVQDLGVLKQSEVATWKETWYINCDYPKVLNHLYYKIKK